MVAGSLEADQQSISDRETVMSGNQLEEANLALTRSIEAQLGTIVHIAERSVILLEKLETSRMEESQLRNVLDVARGSQTVLEVIYFIQYQIGRARIGEHWQYNGFGLQVASDIEESVAVSARQAADGAIAWLAAQGQTVDETAREKMESAAHLQLMIDYLGFLYRAFVYIRNVDEGWSHLSDLVAERTAAETEREESDA
jgi:hypothetical protein